MSTTPISVIPDAVAIRDACLCLQLQRVARTISRYFDDGFRDLGITNGQFSLLNAVSSDAPARLRDVAAMLGMDRTTLTAALKPLVRDGLVVIVLDENDQRIRRIKLTTAGKGLVRKASGLWREKHRALEDELHSHGDELRSELATLGGVLERS